MTIDVIVTVPPYADYIAAVAAHPLVSGLRLNTVMPLKDDPQVVLQRLTVHGKPIWVDLKGRQLRVVGGAIPPYSAVTLSHAIQVETPCDAYFSDGQEVARVVAVDGNRLILADGPRRLIGPGESVNIIDSSLEIEGNLTDTDIGYLKAMRALGMQHVMLSYVQSATDVADVRVHLPDADIVQKIESIKGLDYARKAKATNGRLMAARGDLYVEVGQPHRMLRAMKTVIQADSTAIVASRILNSLAWSATPTSADISDLAWLFSMGYRTLMLGDAICLQKDTVLTALDTIHAVSKELGL